MNEVKIAAIVEGHGERDAVPVLIRRIATDLDPGFVPRVLPPIRTPAARLVKTGEIEKTVELAARQLQGDGGIIILLDCDDGCPATDGPALLARAQKARQDIPISVILAKCEYEAWFLAAAESLRGCRALRDDLVAPVDPEAIRAAKGWLGERMNRHGSYTETEDQAALTTIFDMQAARKADSFDKCYRDIKIMLEKLRSKGP